MTRFTVNDQAVEYRLDPATPLLWALRDASNLTGTRYGCGTGHCGACIVDIDGRAVPSCRISIAEAEGSFVTTIEGLARERDHPLQLAFLAGNVVQCGFCVPGIIMAAAALLRRNPDPDEATIRATITNLCRCGIYPRLVDAIRRAAAAMRGEEVIPATPRPGTAPSEAATTVPALTPRPPER
jgi:isoquinoline 1-oxidoreductase alpha subunit